LPESKTIEAVSDPSHASKPEEFLRPIPVTEIEYWVKHANELAGSMARVQAENSRLKARVATLEFHETLSKMARSSVADMLDEYRADAANLRERIAELERGDVE
jgi:hypothetical protein